MFTVISIHLKSYHPLYLNRFVTKLKEALISFPSFAGKQAFLPTKKTMFTVLRSPHVDKKSREQFERRIYHRVIRWKVFTVQTNNVFPIYYFTQIITKLAVGVQVKMTFANHYIKKEKI